VNRKKGALDCICSARPEAVDSCEVADGCALCVPKLGALRTIAANRRPEDLGGGQSNDFGHPRELL
jgi:hypothetical protein